MPIDNEYNTTSRDRQYSRFRRSDPECRWSAVYTEDGICRDLVGQHKIHTVPPLDDRV